jgi:hypothetical protein
MEVGPVFETTCVKYKSRLAKSKKGRLAIKYFIYSIPRFNKSNSFQPKIEKNEKGGACRAYGGEERCIQGFGGETSHLSLGHPGVDGRIILRWIFRK